MTSTALWWIIGLVAVGGFALRGVFILLPLLPAVTNPRLQLVLGLVPAAAFSALVAPLLLAPEGKLVLGSASALAGAVALALAVRWRNLAVSILGGLATYAVVLWLR